MNDLESIKIRLRAFAAARGWEQFHSPKNISMALIVEAAELVEHFQWLTEEQSKALQPEQLQQVREELADIQIYLIQIADKLNVDLLDAANKKIDLNAKKYPAEEVRGSSKKYTEAK
ncbi:MAG: nucleotide pyrophosphohydrolase [Gallionella sp.]|nr:nucleotide pyrophosphohydrolase [Gallionella sp.]